MTGFFHSQILDWAEAAVGDAYPRCLVMALVHCVARIDIFDIGTVFASFGITKHDIYTDVECERAVEI